MGRVNFTMVRPSYTPDANPETLFQLLAASDHRCLITGADVSLQGTTPSAAPVVFDFLIQSTAGTAGSGATSLAGVLQDRGIDEGIEATFTAYDGSGEAEPGASTVIHEFSVHEQGTFQWRPDKPIIVKTIERVGMRYKRAAFVPVSVTLYCEE